jgi:CheY-like chemotaxis protein
MVVDDDPGIHEALRLTLDDHYEVHSASGGAEALQDLARRHVDLVLLDLLMPGVDGWQVFDRIRLMAPRPKIVFLTAVDRSEAAVTALQSGADDWIVKPFEEPALLTHFRQFGFGTPGILNSYETAGGLYHYTGTWTSGSAAEAVGAGPSGVTRAGGRTPAAAKAW